MAKQTNDSRRIPAGRNTSTGAAVLDRPEHDASETQTNALLQEVLRLVDASHAGHLSERGKAERFEGNNRKLIEGVNTMLDAILLPIGEGNRVLAQISTGKIDELITQTYSGDHEKMKQAVNNVATVLQSMQKELARLTEASRDGLLSERGKPDQFQGAYAGIVKGVNEMLDAILLPIGEGNRILAQISNGKIDELIAQTYKGDHEKMKQAVNGVAAALQYMTKDVNILVKAAVEGKLATRADATKHQGDYRKIVEGVNQTLDAVIGPLNVSAEYVDRISKGDIPPKITDTYNGDFNEIKNNLNVCIEAVARLVADGVGLTQAMLEGKLAVRSDAAKHQGDFRKVIEGFNLALDNVIKPLNVSAEYVDRISKGDIPPKITDTYNGDFNEIKNNLNVCIEAVARLVADGVGLTQAMLEGKLAVRSDAAKHQGDFRKLIEGFNLALDNVIKPLNVSAEYVDRISKGDIPPKITDIYNGDFNEIKNNLNVCIDAVSRLVADGMVVTQAMLEGKLAVRSDAAKHQGDFRKLIEGFNLALDNVIKPLNVSAEYVDRISKGDIPPKITDAYNGDFNEIKNNLNNCIDAIKALVSETGALIKASQEGRLATRADASAHEGDYRKIVAGVNEMLDAILLPIGEGNRILAQISNGKIDELIAQTYKGDHEKMKQAVNNVAAVLQGMQKELGRLTEASRDGQLSERGKADQFQGAYAGIVKGVNEMLDAILLPIGEGNRILAQISNGKIDELIAQTYKGDHEKMKQAVNNVASALQVMAQDIGALVDAAVGGNLGLRSDASKHQGDISQDYRRREPDPGRGAGTDNGSGIGDRDDRCARPHRSCGREVPRRPCRYQGKHQSHGHRSARQHATDHAERLGAGLRLRRTNGHQPANGRQRRGNSDASQRGVGRGRTGVEERIGSGDGRGADADLHPGDRQERQRGGQDCQERRPGCGSDQPHHRQTGRVQPGNRKGDQGHHFHRAADQPSGAERHHRSGSRRRSRQGIRRGGERGQGTGQRNRQSDRGHRAEDRSDPIRHQGRRAGHRRD
jgi:methyl-accepting chemotaxis protein